MLTTRVWGAVCFRAAPRARLREFGGALTTIYYEDDADVSWLAGQGIAVVGYGNQGRCWALNLRDSGYAVRVCVRADATRRSRAC